MTSLERVLATVQGERPDHTPVTVLLSMYGAGMIGAPLSEYYNSPDLFMEGQSAVVETFHPDILTTALLFAGEGEAFGSTIKYFDANPPNITKPAFSEPQAMLDAPLPESGTSKRERYFFEVAERLVSKYGKEIAVSHLMLSPIDLPAVIFGLERWLEIVLFEEETALKICWKLMDFFVKRANMFFKMGVHFIILPVVFANPSIITERVIRRMGLPILTAALKELHGPVVIHHVGTPLNPFAKIMAPLPNVSGMVVDHRDRLALSRELIGDQLTLLGNVNGPTLHRMTPQQIAKMCAAILKERENDRRFVLATSAADIPMATPQANISAIIDSVRIAAAGRSSYE